MESTTKKKKIALLGSTGSIGTQALDVIRQHPDKFEVEVLTAYSNDELLLKQALEFKPNTVVIVDESKYEALSERLWKENIKTYCGEKSLEDVVQMEGVDLVLTALVGYSGLKPTIAAIEAKKPIALANKETLVVAGDLITDLANKNHVPLLPVDSEHSAIFQCLAGEFHNKIEKIYLTASGGPFRGWTTEQLAGVTKAQALKHPNWEMGAKITIDSATLMNKGLEVIEAKWLFQLESHQIETVVHPQSVIHSVVQFEDGSMKAQMGLPDMKLPIQYAMAYPQRITSDFPRFNFMDYPELTFEKTDQVTFKNLALAYKALDLGGTAACALNAANEITNAAFLQDKIKFLDIANINEKVMDAATFVKKPSLDDYVNSNTEARRIATEML
ncbi:MAG: 1-deoxy-D-xylulose-5-phosphate reductoisomerase [Vicingaceae bacterium]|jgi:1-deoxy-D-xylulose-5-phosphate reductoisomerase